MTDDSRVDGLSVVGFVGETTVLVDCVFVVLLWDPALFGVVVLLEGGAWVVAVAGLVQTKHKSQNCSRISPWYFLFLSKRYFKKDLFFLNKRYKKEEDGMDLTLWFLADKVDFGIAVYVVQFCVREFSTVFILEIVVWVPCLPRSANCT
jgi:hypothetical protein